MSRVIEGRRWSLSLPLEEGKKELFLWEAGNFPSRRGFSDSAKSLCAQHSQNARRPTPFQVRCDASSAISRAWTTSASCERTATCSSWPPREGEKFFLSSSCLERKKKVVYRLNPFYRNVVYFLDTRTMREARDLVSGRRREKIHNDGRGIWRVIFVERKIGPHPSSPSPTSSASTPPSSLQRIVWRPSAQAGEMCSVKGKSKVSLIKRERGGWNSLETAPPYL